MEITKLKAKFKVDSVTLQENQTQQVVLFPVLCDTEENKTFSKYTPSGKIELTITNPNANSFFTPGKEIYVDFTQA